MFWTPCFIVGMWLFRLLLPFVTKFYNHRRTLIMDDELFAGFFFRLWLCWRCGGGRCSRCWRGLGGLGFCRRCRFWCW